MSRRQITLHGERSERWEEVLDDLEEELGYEPTQPEALGLLMAQWESDESEVLD